MHVAITGASSGIGEALVREFLRAGASVTMIARRRELMEAIASSAGGGGKARVVVADLGKVATACDWIADAENALGPIDVLINNAGVQHVEPSHTIDTARGLAEIEVDLLVPLALTRALLPGMVARKSGTIVDVASVAGLAPTPGMWHYNAAKGGLAAASESLRGELRGSGVHVVTVYPGPVDTPMARAGYLAYPESWATKMVPEGKPDVLARRVRAAVEKRRARVIYPRWYVLTRWFPGSTRWFLDHFTPAPFSLEDQKKAAQLTEGKPQ